MDKLLFLISIISYPIIINCSEKESILQQEEIQKEKIIPEKESIVNQCKEILNNLAKLPEEMLKKKEEAKKKFDKALPTAFGGSKDIYLYEYSFYNSLEPEAKNINEQIKLENIQEAEYNSTILTHLKTLQGYFNFNSDSPLAVNYAYRGIDQIAKEGLTQVKITAELLQLKSQLKFQRLYQDCKKDLIKIDKYIDHKLTKKENELGEKIGNAFSEKISEIKDYIGITEEDGISIRNYINKKENDYIQKYLEEIKKIKEYTNEKEKNIKNILEKSIFSLSRISLSIILGLFAYQTYNRLIKIYNENITKKQDLKSLLKSLRKNITHIIDSCVLIGSTIYIINTPSYLNKIWEKKNS
jgi:hypothetical protein